MKTSELTGALLDYWVARASGLADPVIGSDDVCRVLVQYTFHAEPQRVNFFPGSVWMDGGPIIERAGIGISPYRGKWGAWLTIDSYVGNPNSTGEAPLIAAMRCYLSSKFGGEVPDEIAAT
jgi:hypothetical protein